ncbi:Uncharacterised protein [Fusobacterium necrogenes]|uniref:Uncharacterized protein n=1 Tax=Fusobacterium necrogenes TaxID=858 RepID=A0A377GXM2_9FUSO|nr:hypothetical protein [Fusobacterium necrogenes]STO31311.1 Uncharacterised protein [Fusobacterium necrogenes]
MSTAEERFQAMMAKRKKAKETEQKVEKPIVVNEKNSKKDIKEIFLIEDSVFGDLTTDIDLIEYLKNKSLEMLKIQGNNIIMLGKNLTEVFDELGRKGSPEGLYIKYLEFNGYKKDTALRLRKRYELFKKAKSEVVKQIISILPVRSIEQLYKEQNEIIPELEKNSENLTYKKMMDMLKKNSETIEIKNKKEVEISGYDVDRIDNLYKKINRSYGELDEKRKEKLDKLLFEIEKLLG